MNGEYIRVTPDELRRAVEDPVWALDLAYGIQDSEEGKDLPSSDVRYLTTHKAWHAISFLLERARFPVDIVNGEVAFAEDEDWGYGPPRYLPADRVRIAAHALAATPYDASDALEWVRGWFEPLVPYVEAAAQQGHALIIWLD